ncbi:unnamed protein product [Dovyalis caffra]|uniref:Uncharacterized protein n=1 Tax=Dovyalis caffra TaxID=77055 RepID=A0AAV1SAD5_9ROSI|nr:unnamed protein product [Dovyalis caffra]
MGMPFEGWGEQEKSRTDHARKAILQCPRGPLGCESRQLQRVNLALAREDKRLPEEQISFTANKMLKYVYQIKEKLGCKSFRGKGNIGST